VKRPCASAWALAFALFAVVAATGCGGEDLVFPGMIPPTETATPVETPTCGVSGDACTLNTDCCSGQCVTSDGVNFFCQ
jgi:hypothetical protein